MGAIAQASQNIEKSNQQSFKELLNNSWPRIQAVLPKHMDPERMYQLAISTYNQTPELADCTTASILSCLMKCSALGLEPSAVDGLGRAYILPFYSSRTQRKEAVFILGYTGMLELARRSGKIKDISARVVHQGDEFEYEFGLTEALRHVPSNEPIKDRPMTHVYMVAHFTDGGHYIEVMSKSEVDEVRACSKADKKGDNPKSIWSTNYDAMAKKTVIRRAFKFLPVSVESARDVMQDGSTPIFKDESGIALFPDQIGEDSSFEDTDTVNVDPETGEVK